MANFTARRPRIGGMFQGILANNKQAIYENAFEGFLQRADEHDDPNKPKLRTAIFALLEFGGLFDPDLFRAWLPQVLRPRMPRLDEHTTLRQFHAATRNVGRELSVVITDTTDCQPLVLNHRTAPDCPVVEAVLMSLSVPMVWPETQWRKEWGMYLARDIEGHYMVDGGVLANFPIYFLLHRDRQDMRHIFGDPENEAPAIVGLLLDGSLAVPGDVKFTPEKPDFQLFDRINRVFGALGAWQDDLYRGAENLICRIGTKGHPALELQKTPEAILRLQTLVNSGRCAMTDYLKKRKLF